MSGEGGLAARPQEGEPSFCKPIRREDGEADWRLPAAVLLRRLRAFTPWPGLFTFLGAERIKILDAQTASNRAADAPGTLRLEGAELIAAAGEGLFVATTSAGVIAAAVLAAIPSRMGVLNC